MSRTELFDAPTRVSPGRPARRVEPVAILFSATILVSSALLFLVQPLVAKMVLPRFGGVPAVWTTSMVFFQAALLAGYFYSHATIRRLGARRQTLIHLPLLVATVAFLPLAVRSGGEGSHPALGILAVLTASVGLPFFTVATSGPLLQRWLAASNHPSGRDPYFLYATSNLGSLVGLLAYPVVLEPSTTLEGQARLWSAGFALLIALTAACALVVRRGAGRAGISAAASSGIVETPAPSAARRLRWILLAFVPSSLMLGVTSHFTTDIAPMPLLWVVPLALYLITFVLTFASRVWVSHATMVRALPFTLLPLVVLMGLHAGSPAWFVGAVHLGTFFVAAMVCHGALAADRPGADRLTEFYLLVSVGGVLGGVANAIVAPLVFDAILEYPLALVLAALFVRRGQGPDRGQGSRALVFDVAAPAALAALLVVVGRSVGGGDMDAAGRLLLFGLPAIVCFAFVSRPIRFSLGIAALLLAGSFNPETPGRELFRDRTFFGVQTVVAAPNGVHLYKHGNTVHGAQVPGSLEPLTYYHRGSPIADVFAAGTRRSVAAIGLGAGSIACYGTAGERWRFYEIDPVVEQVARDPRYFTFLRDCPVRPEVVIGDARLSMAAERGTSYDLVVVDAFNSDAIPVHLMTREALQLYLDRLAPGGMLAFHVSHRYLSLTPVMAALAADRGLVARVRGDSITAAEFAAEKRPSLWVVMARDDASLGRIAGDGRWTPPEAPAGQPVWTDGFSNVLSTFRWR